MRTKREIESAFAKRSELDRVSTLLLVGIGGAGMSALARLLKHKGLHVVGQDRSASENLRRLRAEGYEITQEEAMPARRGVEAVVLTDAVDLNRSAIVRQAREQGLPVFRRSQAIGWALRDKKVIAVTGTHGKTSTSAMIGAMMLRAGLDPLALLGAGVPDLGGSYRHGEGEWAVVEACEAYESYRDMDPTIAVLTNLEPDHLDYHGDWAGLLASMRRFLARVPEDGQVIYGAEDAGAREAVEGVPAPTQPFTQTDFERLLGSHGADAGRIVQLNAAAAAMAASAAGASEAAIQEAFREFRGVARRQEWVQVPVDLADRIAASETGEIFVVDDYAHHPTEIVAAIEAAQARVKSLQPNHGGRTIAVFQPHLYSRTRDHVGGFAEALDHADLVFLTDIYPAREDPMPGVSSFLIAEKMRKPVEYVTSRHLLARAVAAKAQPGDLVLVMGAGNIDELPKELVCETARSNEPLRVDVVYGGDSAEREVSLHSGRAAYEACERLGHRARLVDVTELLHGERTVKPLLDDRPNVAVLMVHGTNAEDGAIQGFFELMHIPYTGSGIQASALAMDKEKAKRLLEAAGVDVPRGQLVQPGEAVQGDLKPPLVVKPNEQGSTVGLTFVESAGQLQDALHKAWAYGPALVEEQVSGVEISVPVLVDRALPAVEIVPRSGRYDFSSKYQPGATEEICPARLDPKVAERAAEIALDAHRALGCAGVSRTDMIVTDERIVALEVNTLPGMTATSLVPRAAEAAGLSFDDVIEKLIREVVPTCHGTQEG